MKEDNDVVKKFRAEIERAKRAHVAYNTHIVCAGSVVLTVLPNLKSKTPTSYQLEMPEKITVEHEFPFVVTFIAALCGIGALTSIGGTLKNFFFKSQPFQMDFGGFRLVGSHADKTNTLLATPIKDKVVRAKPLRTPGRHKRNGSA